VGGSLDSPPGFWGLDTGPWHQRLRALDDLRIQHDRSLRRSFERAAVVLGIADYVREFLDALSLDRIEAISETGLVSIPPADPPWVPVTFSDAERLRLLPHPSTVATMGAAAWWRLEVVGLSSKIDRIGALYDEVVVASRL
jgi:hypothetical protein